MRIAGAVPAVMMLVLVAASARGDNCGSALLAQTQTPAVFQGITLGGSTVARMWAAGSAGQYSNANACAVGCAGFSASPLCVNGGDCIAVTGVNWINTGCSPAGFRPTRTVFLVEAPTASSGGVWAAFNLEHNTSPSTDSNYDLDAKAEGDYSTASPYIGGTGQPITVTFGQRVGNVVTLSLTWLAPVPVAETLNNSGASLVTSYSVYWAHSSGGNPPGSTGSKGGWTWVADADGTQTNGYSTDRSATISIDTQGLQERFYVAIGLNFDGSGNPAAPDHNTVASTYISMPSLAWCPPPAPTPTASPAPTPTGTPSMPTPTPTATPTPTPIVPPQPSPTVTPTPTRTP